MNKYDENLDDICNACSGSGEGYTDGSTCNRCKGSGVQYPDFYEENTVEDWEGSDGDLDPYTENKLDTEWKEFVRSTGGDIHEG